MEGILLGVLGEAGPVQERDLEDAIHAVQDPHRFVWAHAIVTLHETAYRFLHQGLGFHPLAVEDVLSPFERPSLVEYEDHAFLTLSALKQISSGPEFVEVGVFVRETAVVTVVREPCRQIDELRQRWLKNPNAVGSSPAWVIHAILDTIVDDYFPAVDSLEDRIDHLADHVYSGKTLDLAELSLLRRNLLEMRRRNSPTRDVLNILLRRDFRFGDPQVLPYFQDVYDHTLRIAEAVEMCRESLSGLVEAHMSAVSNSLNQVMKKMTVISTMLMAAALVAGVYGMNFERMPELQWSWGYPFALVLMLVSMGVVFGFFRWRKWV
jgi:magnesium transporter